MLTLVAAVLISVLRLLSLKAKSETSVEKDILGAEDDGKKKLSTQINLARLRINVGWPPVVFSGNAAVEVETYFYDTKK